MILIWPTVLTLLIAMLPATHSAKILGIFPVPANSHNIVFTAVTRELARRGHQLTVISTFPEKTPIPNITYIGVQMFLSDACK